MNVAIAADVKADQSATPSKNSQAQNGMDVLLDLVSDDLKAVNALIMKHMQSDVVLIPQLAGHLIAAGGKRLRPLLTLASSRLCGYKGDRHLGLAACIEFIHTATLLHDDVVDESDLRRGRDTANALFGNKPSVLVGDFLFSRAFQLMSRDSSLEVIRILSDASAVIAEGEVQQLMTSNDLETDRDAYLKVISGKTAVLFAASCQLGAVVADRPQNEADALEAYGQYLGIAFQLVDDILDYSAKQAALGKTVGDDFREGKMTLPIILAYEKATAGNNAEELAFWKRVIEELDQSDRDLDHAIALMHKHNALEDSMSLAREYVQKAIDALAIFPDSPEKNALVKAVEFSISREF
ncbi:polyprenyl synthetase family protein [Kiloniella laminariae]|uniref:Polyprenyl synthetase family protein n=1 Tax=Kiloniella laminariae TaxID=454162 RepID=A0ABT4LEI5_9PROT|nr:polyprenyl synthetase family protein [Kiloniella laminariae]MCZ4279514.1 polyprenyl synthetase family protein [Kiloniella laminariae]